MHSYSFQILGKITLTWRVISQNFQMREYMQDWLVTTTAIHGVLYTVAGKFQPLPQDIYRYDWREPFSLPRGWLLWAGIGLVGAVVAVALTGAATSFFSGQTPEREVWSSSDNFFFHYKVQCTQFLIRSWK
ncbi:hypothetical protein RchiOBHm_Chr4g0413061 [Rosa chinensis]|uniref:Uncharacterized protein n=1 Tax=Rosa chinensis TaxID=74649 RepID=A0A2P6QVZ4_ROSCH|nr:hypothetical protein RchiOBHm_Chr4g0413061 [Rosa chinensis]